LELVQLDWQQQSKPSNKKIRTSAYGFRYLAAENAFTTIRVLDQRPAVGGVWNYSFAPAASNQADLTIPRTRPSSQVEEPVAQVSSETREHELCFPSPIYDFLETNIPHTLMNFSDKKFPEGSALFPKFAVVKQYLEEYADDIRGLVNLATQVVSVGLTADNQWMIKTRDIRTQKEGEEIYDAVVVASGHYSDPFIPDIKGIQDFRIQHPTTISHSKYYRRPEVYAGKVRSPHLHHLLHPANCRRK
jgi:cation diffusion facilitator CzcD-associated flavoprotein CzcO